MNDHRREAGRIDVFVSGLCFSSVISRRTNPCLSCFRANSLNTMATAMSDLRIACDVLAVEAGKH